MKNSRLTIAFPLACALLLAAFIVPVSATTYNPGVSVGQYVKYGDYVINTPAGTITSPDWTMVEVVGVSGKEVTLRTTGAYMNGTAIPPSDLLCNIETHQVHEGLWVSQNYLLAANLNQGDKTLNEADAPTINTTETRTILGTSRTVNVINITNSYPTQNIRSVVIYDQASGMSVSWEMEITIIAQAVTYTSSYHIIDTNIFDVEPIPEFQSWMLLPLLMTATVLVVVLKKRGHLTQQ